MTKERALRIGACLFAAALFAVSAMQASLGQEPHGPRARAEERGVAAAPDHSAVPSQGSGGQGKPSSTDDLRASGGDEIKTQDPSGTKQATGDKSVPKEPATGSDGGKMPEHSGATDGRPPVQSRTPDASPIDTSIAVQPPSRSGRTGPAHHGKKVFKIVAPEKLPARRAPASGSANPVVRNAIGMPVTSRQVVRGPYSAAPGPAAARYTSVPGRLAAPNASLAATLLHGARIDGASMVRPVMAAPVLGGPAKPVVAGISGTMVRRPKR
jgi:hypothetical protein